MKPMGINKSVCILTYRNDKLSGKCTRIDDKNHKQECTLKDVVLDGPFSDYDKKGTLIVKQSTRMEYE